MRNSAPQERVGWHPCDTPSVDRRCAARDRLSRLPAPGPGAVRGMLGRAVPAQPRQLRGPVVDAVLAYKGAGRRMLLALKYGNAKPVARSLASAMARRARRYQVDVVTWAPTASARRRERGYDQAEVLARAVAWRLGVPCRRLSAGPMMGLLRPAAPAPSAWTARPSRPGVGCGARSWWWTTWSRPAPPCARPMPRSGPPERKPSTASRRRPRHERLRARQRRPQDRPASSRTIAIASSPPGSTSTARMPTRSAPSTLLAMSSRNAVRCAVAPSRSRASR